MGPPDMSDLLNANDEFNRIFNTQDFRKVNHPIKITVVA